MICDNCGQRDAVINLTQVEHEAKVTLHLCEQCAQKKGVETGAPLLKSPLGDFIKAVGKGAGALAPKTADGSRCPECGASMQDFRETGRLGCAACYSAFSVHLRDLLRRLHGSSQHTGRRYRAPGDGPRDPRAELLDLRERLRRAVQDENFELAAELRDQIRVHD